MSMAREHGWTLSDFLAWEAGQERRHAFIDGEVVMMTGGTQAHALIAANLLAFLRPALRGSLCRPFGSDMRLPIPDTGNSRYPDVMIDCGRFQQPEINASEPTVIFEVLSSSTAWYDQTRKLRDDESLPSLRQYVCVSQSERRVSVWTRDATGRLVPEPDLTGEDDALLLAIADIRLPLAAIYEDIGF
ncbi:Uma2 family endonuclease [Mangrovibrevibacter kandeliae]|uniref:Uma2 family endonuclease n=1 Tax=Mangrovibrevibacter kandeliae TaxID=2968473 RepID=UPI002117BB1F|nr:MULTISPECIES: Uma2 family endonuclease [unclassified Aurantimonas]MCQ8781333.1 Uma2 family endonuclease [Aurantimonas sp. CSK15Z-1]MCW4114115.1 Uma2 family endonuclease [Aurantimonas sp. MSK8Z-1]